MSINPSSKNSSDPIEALRRKLLQAMDTEVFQRSEVADLLEAYGLLVRRFDRVVRISDSFQYDLKTTSKALEEALAQVKMLSGLIPICAACKKVKSVEGYWKQIEQYIIENSEADFTHGLCPDCASKYMQMAVDDAPAQAAAPHELSLPFTDDDVAHPVVAHYLTLINNRDFAHTPLYGDLVRLLKKYVQLERRMQRIVRISDNYQSELHEIREKFEREARHDYLTGLSNRREMYLAMEAEISRIHRHGGTFALIMFDFDRFKNINDEYGHEAGDAILRHAAHLVQGTLRKQDRCARWGGEEFLVLQPESNPDGVMHCCERLRNIIAQTPLRYGDLEIGVTISLGVAIYRKGEKLEECINRADKSLYVAKEAGKNRTGPLEDPPT